MIEQGAARMWIVVTSVVAGVVIVVGAALGALKLLALAADEIDEDGDDLGD